MCDFLPDLLDVVFGARTARTSSAFSLEDNKASNRPQHGTEMPAARADTAPHVPILRPTSGFRMVAKDDHAQIAEAHGLSGVLQEWGGWAPRFLFRHSEDFRRLDHLAT